ncbi:hypothetical protein ACFYWX_12885 [Streptomyces sp. NPDC002888]
MFIFVRSYHGEHGFRELRERQRPAVPWESAVSRLVVVLLAAAPVVS